MKIFPLKTLIIACLFPLYTFSQMERDSLLLTDINELVHELKFMYDYDQVIRKYKTYQTFDESEIDSIESLNDSLKRKEVSRRKISPKVRKKIWKEYTIPFDIKSTERLIEITKKYGFPSIKRLKKYYKKEFIGVFNPYILFVHSPTKYFDEIKEIMKTEFEKGIINKCEYGHLLWHLNGRNDFKYFLENGFEFIENKKGIRMLKAVDCD